MILFSKSLSLLFSRMIAALCFCIVLSLSPQVWAQSLTVHTRHRAIDTKALQQLAQSTSPGLLQRLGDYNWVINKFNTPLMMHPDGQVAYGFKNKSLHRIDLETGEVKAGFAFDSSQTPLMSFEGEYIIGASNKQFLRLNTEDGKVTMHPVKNAVIRRHSLSRDGSLVIALVSQKNQRRFMIWKTKDFSLVHSSPALDGFRSFQSTRFAWSKDNNRIWLTTYPANTKKDRQSRVYLYDIKARSMTQLEGFRLEDSLIEAQTRNKNTVRAISNIYLNAQENQLITVENMGVVARWDLSTGKMIDFPLRVKGYLNQTSLSRDRNYLSVSTFSRTGSALAMQRMPDLPKAGEVLNFKGGIISGVVIVSLKEEHQHQPVRRIIPGSTGHTSWSIDNETIYVSQVNGVKTQILQMNTDKMAPLNQESLMTSVRLKNGDVITLGQYGSLSQWEVEAGKMTIRKRAGLPISTMFHAACRMYLSPDEKYLIILDVMQSAYLVEVSNLKLVHRLRSSLFNDVVAISAKVGSDRDFFLVRNRHIVPLRIDKEKLQFGPSKLIQSGVYAYSAAPVAGTNQVLIPRETELMVVDLSTGRVQSALPISTQFTDQQFQASRPIQVSIFPDSAMALLLYRTGLRVVNYLNGQIIMERALIKLTAKSGLKNRRQQNSGFVSAFPINSNHFILAHERGHWQLHDLKSDKAIQTGKGHVAMLRHIQVMPKQQLFMISADSTASLWQLKFTTELPKLTDEELRKLWEQFIDPKFQLQAQVYLSRMSQHHLGLLDKLMKPAVLEREKAKALIQQLGAASADERLKAKEELLIMGRMVVPLLEKASDEVEDLDHHQACIETLKSIESDREVHPQLMRQLHMIKVLKGLSDPKAKSILNELSKGNKDSRVTQAAIQALK